ncbi:MAG: hypothetical protein ABIU11_07250 [Chitinophagaceae bacterium]
MYKIYSLLFTTFLFSCNTKIRYIGKSLPETQHIEIFIAEKSIKQPFEYIGKGYLGFFKNPNKIQKKAEKIAREKGADAVLITDYYIPDAGGTNITTVNKTDSIAKTSVTTANANVTPNSFSGYQILFLKYTK